MAIRKQAVIRKSMAGILFSLLLAGCIAQPEQLSQSDSALRKSVESYNTLGFAYLERGNMERAKRAFVKARSLDDESADALHGMALIYQQEGEFQLAESAFRDALDAEDTYSVARNNFAAFLYARKRYQEACWQLEIAVQDTLYVNRAQAFENLGRCRLQLGQVGSAEQAFLRALQLDRHSARALLELAELRERQQRPLEAWNYLQQHLKVAKASKRGLMLGIRLTKQLGKDAQYRRYLAQLNRLKHTAEDTLR